MTTFAKVLPLPGAFLSLAILLLSCGPPPNQPTNSPSASATENEVGDFEGVDVSGACGVERWSVKTGTDPAVSAVDLNQVQDTTVGHLADPHAFPNPGEPALKADNQKRIPPLEATVFRVGKLHLVNLVGYKREKDSDLHLVLAGEGVTMIAEIPKAPCVAAGSPFRDMIVSARQAFDQQYPRAERNPGLTHVNRPVTVTGVGFYDFLHGQTGVAPNGVELHPVLRIEFV